MTTLERRYHDINRTLNPTSLLICLAGLLAIAFSISLRVSQTTLLPNHITPLHLPFHIFDKLNASYEHTLIISLILSGLIVDLVGPRIILCSAIAIAMIMNYFYYTADSLQTLFACRLLTEYSHVFIIMSVLTLGSHWLPRRHFSVFVGLLFGTLLMVPVVIRAPLATHMAHQNLAYLSMTFTLIGMIILSLIFSTQSKPDMTRRRNNIYSRFHPLYYYKIWLIGLVAMIGWMTNMFILRVGEYYIAWKAHFNIYQAMNTVDATFIYFGLGAIVMGIIADFIEEKRYLIVISFIVAAIAFAILIFSPNLTPASASYLLYCTAFFASSSVVSYTKANDYCKVENSGVALGLILSISTIGSSLFAKSVVQYVNKHVYSSPIILANDWATVVMLIPIALLMGSLITFLFLKPTNLPQEQQRKDDRRLGYSGQRIPSIKKS